LGQVLDLAPLFVLLAITSPSIDLYLLVEYSSRSAAKCDF